MEFKLSPNEVKNVLQIMATESKAGSLASVARKLGYKETTFRSALNTVTKTDGTTTGPSIRLKDFMAAAHIMGYEVIVRKKE